MIPHVSIVLAARHDYNYDAEGSEFSSYLVKYSKGISLVEEIAERFKQSEKTIIVVSSNHFNKLPKLLQLNNTEIKVLKFKTQGALISLGMVLDEIPKGIPILVAPGDALIDLDLNAFLEKMSKQDVSVGMAVFKSSKNVYSYLRVVNETIIELVEKEVKGSLATSGLYFFKEKEVILRCVEWAVLNGVKVNNQYYLSTSINKLITDGERIGIFEIDEDCYYRFSTRNDASESIKRIVSN